VAGDSFATEAAICFLEARPYFFRSGYMFSDIMRKIKRVPLTPEQAGRLELVIARQALWSEKRLRKNAA
jgi:predicted Rdx family selenoprotein